MTEIKTHVGRSFIGHALEDSCPCQKGPCGLAIEGSAPDCPEHALGTAKTIRQSHRAADCEATGEPIGPGPLSPEQFGGTVTAEGHRMMEFEDGTWCAYGHLTRAEFQVAFNDANRQTRTDVEIDFVPVVDQRWAVLTSEAESADDEWEIRFPFANTAETPGAFPVTIWGAATSSAPDDTPWEEVATARQAVSAGEVDPLDVLPHVDSTETATITIRSVADTGYIVTVAPADGRRVHFAGHRLDVALSQAASLLTDN